MPDESVEDETIAALDEPEREPGEDLGPGTLDAVEEADDDDLGQVSGGAEITDMAEDGTAG